MNYYPPAGYPQHYRPQPQHYHAQPQHYHTQPQAQPPQVGSGGGPSPPPAPPKESLPRFPNIPELVCNIRYQNLLESLLPVLEKYECLSSPVWKGKRSPWVRAYCELYHPVDGPWGARHFKNAPASISTKARYSFKSYKLEKIYECLQKCPLTETSTIHANLYQKLKEFKSKQSYYDEYMSASKIIAEQETRKPLSERAPIPSVTIVDESHSETSYGNSKTNENNEDSSTNNLIIIDVIDHEDCSPQQEEQPSEGMAIVNESTGTTERKEDQPTTNPSQTESDEMEEPTTLEKRKINFEETPEPKRPRTRSSSRRAATVAAATAAVVVAAASENDNLQETTSTNHSRNNNVDSSGDDSVASDTATDRVENVILDATSTIRTETETNHMEDDQSPAQECPPTLLNSASDSPVSSIRTTEETKTDVEVVSPTETAINQEQTIQDAVATANEAISTTEKEGEDATIPTQTESDHSENELTLTQEHPRMLPNSPVPFTLTGEGVKTHTVAVSPAEKVENDSFSSHHGGQPMDQLPSDSDGQVITQPTSPPTINVVKGLAEIVPKRDREQEIKQKRERLANILHQRQKDGFHNDSMSEKIKESINQLDDELFKIIEEGV